MIHVQMPVSAEHEAVVTLEFVRIDNGPSADLFDRQPQQCLGRHIRNHRDLNDTVSLQDTEDRNLAGGTTTSFPFPLAAEVALVQFALSSQ